MRARSLDDADRLIVLQHDALRHLPPHCARKSDVVYQSARTLAPLPRKAPIALHCVLVAHLARREGSAHGVRGVAPVAARRCPRRCRSSAPRSIRRSATRRARPRCAIRACSGWAARPHAWTRRRSSARTCSSSRRAWKAARTSSSRRSRPARRSWHPHVGQRRHARRRLSRLVRGRRCRRPRARSIERASPRSRVPCVDCDAGMPHARAACFTPAGARRRGARSAAVERARARAAGRMAACARRFASP